MTPGKIGLIFGLVAVAAIVAGIATAFVISELFSDDDSDADPGAWRTYSNDSLGFEIDYPGDWHLVERLPPIDSDEAFVSGGVTISEQPEVHEGPYVLAYKNFRGDWCLLGRLEDSAIEVSGVIGVETKCFGCEADAPKSTCPADPYTIVRVFGSVAEPGNYVVLGDVVGQDVDTVRLIVESFRFID